MSYERLRTETLFEGGFFDVVRERVRYEDGSEHEREFARHPGAVAILPHDSERIYMVRQPRESVGEGDLLELPAGKLDAEGESPLECARRELREEIGMRAARWSELKRIYTSPGFTSEEVHVFEATGLEAVGADPGEGERIEVVTHPIAEIDAVIANCLDATSLVGLLLFRERLAP
ncbi:MAG: NUDIX domain-containing protein [Solirubrobacterales bacterium]